MCVYLVLLITHSASNIGVTLNRFRNKARQFFIPLPFNLHDYIGFFPKFYVRVNKLLGGAKILPKSSTLCVGAPTSQTTDRRHTDLRRHRRT